MLESLPARSATARSEPIGRYWSQGEGGPTVRVQRCNVPATLPHEFAFLRPASRHHCVGPAISSEEQVKSGTSRP